MRQKPQSPSSLAPMIPPTQLGARELASTIPVSEPKRSQSAWVLTAWLFLLIQSFSVVVQAQDYILHRMELKQGAVTNGMNDWGMVIGYHDSPDSVAGSPQRGFVYDHLGLIDIDLPQTVHSIDEWIVTPDGYNGSSCVSINNNFQAVGYFSDSTGGRIGYILDLITGDWQLLPRPSWSAYSYGIRINESGDVVISSQNTLSSPTRFQVDIVNISTGFPIPIDSYSDVKSVRDLNNFGQVAAILTDNSPVIIDYINQSRTPIPFEAVSLNDYGVAAVTYTVPASRGRTETRVGRLFAGVLDEIANFKSWAKDINDLSDVLAVVPSGSTSALFTDESGWKLVNDAVKGAADATEWQFWTNSNTKSKSVSVISNRIDGACWMAGRADFSQTTGSGKKAVTTRETRWYLMIP